MIRQSANNRSNQTQVSIEKITPTYNYVGKFKDGFKHGDGSYTRKANELVFIYKGNFERGSFNGEGTISINAN
jgi:hypothetical protein